MSQFPPRQDALNYGRPNEAAVQRTSGVAIAALISSLVFCIPFVPSAAGMILGIIGLILTAKPNVRGRGLAIAGVLLGLIGVLGWSLATYKVVTSYVAPFNTMVKFTKYTTSGDPVSAAALTIPPFNNDDLPGITARLKALGTFQTLKQESGNKVPFKMSTTNGLTTYGFTGQAIFTNGVQLMEIELRETPNGWRVSKFTLTDPPKLTTRPVGADGDSPATIPSGN